MPCDREIHFGFVGPSDVFNFADKIGSKITDRDGNTITADQFIAATDRCADFDDSDFRKKLRTAFINTVIALGWETGKIQSPSTLKNNQNYIGVVSPWGNRAAGIWDLDIQFDPYEIGDTAEDISFGVNLSSRYFPSILDMKNEHGALGSSIILNKELLDKIEICKQMLIDQIPELSDAVIYIRDIFY